MLVSKPLTALLVTILMGVAITLLYAPAASLLATLRTHAFLYPYWTLVGVEAPRVDAPPAEAVPVLMYHGVVQGGEIGPNTSRANFVSQMETLKRAGYETITVEEYDRFREGTFVLPSKPIIITFDDGRKDSYFTTDEVLRKLGFRATLFVATVRANRNDPFYLSWDEIKEAHQSGRWEIGAHGRESHDDVRVDQAGYTGPFLITRRYDPRTGIESVSDYEKRVDADYVHGIEDIEYHLGFTPRYFSVPLNDYGADEEFEYPGAKEYNIGLTKLYFALSFVQALRGESGALESFYNYRDTDPHRLRRLEVQNLSAEELMASLERFEPRPPRLSYERPTDLETLRARTQLLYGTLRTNGTFVLTAESSDRAGRALFGDWGWRGYRAEIGLAREGGSTATLLVHYLDEDNFINLSWNADSLRLVETVQGVERELAYVGDLEDAPSMEFALSTVGNRLSVEYDGTFFVRALETHLERGALGLSVWQEGGVGEAELLKLVVAPLSSIVYTSAPEVQAGALQLPEAPVPVSTPTPKTIPFTLSDSNDEDWEVYWGEAKLTDTTLVLDLHASTTGSGVAIRDSSSWRNYAVDALLDWYRGRSFSIVVRYQDEKNYALCSFAQYGSGVSITVVKDGVTKERGENYTLGAPFYSPWIQNRLGARVYEDHIECTRDGTWVLRADVPLPERGGVRLETWDPDEGVVRLTVHALSVEEIE